MGIPALPGVYVVILDSRVLYVGQSENMRVRLGSGHGIRRIGGIAKTPWGELAIKSNFRIKFKLSKRLGDMAMWEVRLIKRLRPEFNVKLKPLAVLSGP